LHIWRELSADLGRAVDMAREGNNGESDKADSLVLAAFETWVDDVIIPRLEDEYGLADWEG
jgi:hypothetical protein